MSKRLNTVIDTYVCASHFFREFIPYQYEKIQYLRDKNAETDEEKGEFLWIKQILEGKLVSEVMQTLLIEIILRILTSCLRNTTWS